MVPAFRLGLAVCLRRRRKGWALIYRLGEAPGGSSAAAAPRPQGAGGPRFARAGASPRPWARSAFRLLLGRLQTFHEPPDSLAELAVEDLIQHKV